MRVVMRLVLAEFALAWVVVLAGSIRAGAQVMPIFARTLRAGWRARWRTRVAWSVGTAVAAGWPLLFWLARKQDGYHGWLQDIVVPWWILLAGNGLGLLLAKLRAAGPRA